MADEYIIVKIKMIKKSYGTMTKTILLEKSNNLSDDFKESIYEETMIDIDELIECSK